MFCSCLVDVAKKFSVPFYFFFTCNTAFLGFLLHLPIRNKQIADPFHPSDPDTVIASYRNPVPASVLPGAAMDKTGGGYETYLYNATKFLESKGIIVNSFDVLEEYSFNSIAPALNVYQVGPLLNLKHRSKSDASREIHNWLSTQPPNSVVFLCFGSLGCLDEPQIKQLAIALERSGQRFLWSIRQPPPEGTNGAPTDYENVETVLPEGFLERVKERGMVCGWAPQTDVLAHDAVKGFVSHCGWNSILESLWFGVPIATWPLIAEQQTNAFWLVKEVGLGVELSLSYRSSTRELIMADQIEKAINNLMDDNNPVSAKVKEMSEKSRKALTPGGSSSVNLGKLVQDMLQNIGENN